MRRRRSTSTTPGGRAPPRASHPRSTDGRTLIARLGAAIEGAGLSPNTRDAYLRWARRYVAHHHPRHPASLGRADLARYLEHLATAQGVAARTLNQAASAVCFMYRHLFGVELGGPGGPARARAPARLPTIATPEEIDRLLGCSTGPARVAAMIMYGSGARISETLHIRLKDLDLRSRELTIRHGKGGRDRITVLPRGALEPIRALMGNVQRAHARDRAAGNGWATLPGSMHRKDPRAGWELGWQFLFPSRRLSRDPKTGRRGRAPVHATTLQRAVKRAARRAGIGKPIGCHVLRHCFATEMIRSGCDVRMLQRLMGHDSIETTARYLHVLDRPGIDLVSPLDRLPSMREGSTPASAADAPTGHRRSNIGPDRPSRGRS